MTGVEAVAALPASIKVAGFEVAIEPWPVLTGVATRQFGEWSPLEQTIRIMSAMATPQKAVDTFLHETMHAIYWAYGVHDDDKEERIVAALSTGLMTLHRDNPWLTKWIGDALAQG